MLNTILNAVAGVLHLQRGDACPGSSCSPEPGAQRIELLDSTKRQQLQEQVRAGARVPCWRRYAERVCALFVSLPQDGQQGGSSTVATRSRPAGPLVALPRPMDLRGRRVQVDRLWMSFEGAALDGTSLVLSDGALQGITADADKALPVGLCMALQSLSTIDARHADVRAEVLRQIVLALGGSEKSVAPEVSAVLGAYCDTTRWFAGVPEVEELLRRAGR